MTQCVLFSIQMWEILRSWDMEKLCYTKVGVWFAVNYLFWSVFLLLPWVRVPLHCFTVWLTAAVRRTLFHYHQMRTLLFKDFFLSSYSVHKVMGYKAGGKFFKTFTFLAVFVATSEKNFCLWETERNVAQAAGWGLSPVHVCHLHGLSSQVLCIMVLNTQLLGVFKFFFFWKLL